MSDIKQYDKLIGECCPKKLRSMVSDLSDELPLLQRVENILLVCKNGDTDKETIDRIIKFTYEDSRHPRLGRVFGYSISDYAFAALKWMDTDYSLAAFHDLSRELSDGRRDIIDALVRSRAFEQI